MAAPWTSPDPFLSPPAAPISYCAIYFEEVQREINAQCSALGTTKPTWYRYDSVTERTEIDPSADSSGESLIGHDYSFKPYITDIRDTYEGTHASVAASAGGSARMSTIATGLFSALGLTKQEYLEGKYATADWPSSRYSSWAHSAGALSQDGDLYDRDLDELRSYAVESQFGLGGRDIKDNDFDGLGDEVGPTPIALTIGRHNASHFSRGISIDTIADFPSSFANAAFRFKCQKYNNPWSAFGSLILGYFYATSVTIQKEHYEVIVTNITSIAEMEHSETKNIDVTSVIKAAVSAGETHIGFKWYFDETDSSPEYDYIGISKLAGITSLGPQLDFFGVS